jgi:uncharacterized protein
MLRPPGPETDVFIDASVQAHGGGTVERSFKASQLPRLSEAGIVEPADIHLAVRFSTVEGHVALDGELSGFVTMTCQRCMQSVAVDIADEFQLIIVDSEAQRMEREETSGGYEPVIADPSRLDMRWLAEEQTLLGVPLVAKHADEACAGGAAAPEAPEARKEEGGGQRPFADLRKMLREK